MQTSPSTCAKLPRGIYSDETVQNPNQVNKHERFIPGGEGIERFRVLKKTNQSDQGGEKRAYLEVP